MRKVSILGILLACLSGCLPEQWLNPEAKDSNMLLVPSNPFSATGAVASSYTKVSYSPGDKMQTARVTQLGNQLLTANLEIGMRPKFAIYGTENTEIFHTGTHMIHVTDGLVRKCASDGQVAALLAYEMAQMVIEREALASPKMRTAAKNPPPELVIGNGIGDREPDESHKAELAQFEKLSKRELVKPLALPDRDTLAQRYLAKAGYDVGELEAVRPLLKEAERTYILEKQIKLSGNLTNWVPAPGTVVPGKNTAPTTPPGLNPIGSNPAPTIPGKLNLELPPTLPEQPVSQPGPVPLWQAGK
jgi:hypothetical protein